MTDLEKLTKQIFDEYKGTEDEITIEEAEEMARMEIGAKGIKNYTQSCENVPKTEKKPRTVKISDEKQQLFSEIYEYLYETSEETGRNVQILKENKLISVQIGQKIFKIDVIEQRPTKK